MPLNKDIIGKRYFSPPFEVSRKDAVLYALACGEDNDAYFDERRPGGVIVSPMYAAIYGHGPVPDIIADESVGLSYGSMVLYSHAFDWIAPVRPGDVIDNEAQITTVDIRERGGVLGFEVLSRNQLGETVARAKWAFFDKSSGEPGASAPSRAPGVDEASRPPLWRAVMKIPTYQTFVYSEASGDKNPIHLDDEAARRSGLPGVIVHGMSIMAFCQKAVVDNLCGENRDPCRLKMLSVRFARPVRPGCTVTFEGYSIEESTDVSLRGIKALNEEGQAVLRDARCLVSR